MGIKPGTIEGWGGLTGGDGPAPAYIPIYGDGGSGLGGRPIVCDDQDFGI